MFLHSEREIQMKYGLYLPNFGDYSDVNFTALLAHEAEKNGWDGFFVWDHLTHPNFVTLPFSDPWILLTAIALATKLIKFGALVTPIARRRPWKLAKETATLDHLSEGRIIFGAGLGTHDVEFLNFGDESDPKIRAEMLDEGLEIINQLWSGEIGSMRGKHYSVIQSQLLPACFQKPRIPVWIAGLWPNKKPLFRSFEWDGYFPMKKTKEDRFLLPDEIYQTRKMIDERSQMIKIYDLVASGYTDKMNWSENVRFVNECQQAGGTWWLEALDPWRLSGKEALRRIKLGPPV